MLLFPESMLLNPTKEYNVLGCPVMWILCLFILQTFLPLLISVRKTNSLVFRFFFLIFFHQKTTESHAISVRRNQFGCLWFLLFYVLCAYKYKNKQTWIWHFHSTHIHIPCTNSHLRKDVNFFEICMWILLESQYM